jgi:hypothetical protein
VCGELLMLGKSAIRHTQGHLLTSASLMWRGTI